MTTPEEQSSERPTIDPVDPRGTTIHQQRWSALFVVCCFFGGLNFFGVLILDGGPSALLAALVLGAISAELGLTATWAVLGPGRVSWRFLTAFWATIGLALVCLGTLAATGPRFFAPVEMFSSLLFLPFIFLAAQVPLWLLRFIRGYQLIDIHQPEDDRPVVARQFGVAHLLGATTVLAVAIGLVNTAIQLTGEDALGAWMSLLGICAVVDVYIVLTTMPALWAVFGPWKHPGEAVFLLVLYSFVLSYIELAVLSLFFGLAVGDAAIAFIAFHVAVVGATAVPFGLLRRLGYRLERPGRAIAASHDGSETEEETIGADLQPDEDTCDSA